MRFSLLVLQILLFLLAGSASAQTIKDLGGFLDISWGTSAGEARRTMLSRPGVTLKRKPPGAIFFSGGSFAGRPVNTFGLYFSGDRLYRGEAALAPAGDRDAVLQGIKKELTAKYGTPTKTGRNGFVRWSFPASSTRPVAEAIELSLTKKHNEVLVVYINETMAKSATEDKDEL